MEVIGLVVILLGLFFLVCLVVRYRQTLGRWIRDDNTPSSLDPNARRKRLARTIEDAQEELARLDEEGR